MGRRYLQILVFIVLLLNLLSTFFIMRQTELAITTGNAAQNQGVVSFCLNAPPSLAVPCNPNMSQDVPYACQLLGSDPEGVNLTYFVIPQPPDNTSIFNVSSSGMINFTPSNADRGNHSVLFGVDDNSGCSNAYAYEPFAFTVENINDPPYLIRAIPSQTMSVNTTLVAFYLDDYFADPDDDPLVYTYLRGTSDVQVNVTITADSAVVFTAASCGKSHFQFVATDPGNLSANSNAIQVEVNCPQDQTGGTSTGTSGVGGGGGGGGYTPPCDPELLCLPWSECYPNGLQSQICTDKNGCSDAKIRFQRNCTYVGEQPACEENWLCTDWSVCSLAGKQNRTCDDLNRCHSLRYRPPLEQDCVYNPRCDDNIQNGNETGIDCGGECEPCKEIQQPSVLPALSGFSTLLSLFLLLILGILLALFILYRERIYEGLSELGWMLARRRRKELLLDATEKRLLFDDMRLLERDLSGLAPEKAYERLASILRKLVSFVYDLPFEYLPEELAPAQERLQVSDELRDVLEGVIGRLALLESGRLPVTMQPVLFSSILEETRLLVCLCSDYTVAEIERSLPERAITDRLPVLEEIRLRLLNAHEALQFLRTDAAKNEYARILKAYALLTSKEKIVLYPEIHRLYSAILYVGETEE